MKHAYMIFLLSMGSISLNAMVPDVTRWQELCKNLEEKQKLMTIYKDFCQKRVKNTIPWVVGGWASCALFVPKFLPKAIRYAVRYHETKITSPVISGFLGFLAMRQTYFFGRDVYRSNLAQQEDLSYLNHDVLEQLGYPWVGKGTSVFRASTYVDSNTYTKNFFGGQYLLDKRKVVEDLSVDTVEGIEKALFGRYNAKDQDWRW